MNKYQQAVQIRSRKLGLLLLDARKTHRRSQEECAAALDISLDRYQSFEAGRQSPSLPELELFALYLNIPLEHFWGNQTLAEKQAATEKKPDKKTSQLRHRMIGIRVKLLRNESNLTIKQLSEQSQVPEELLSAYESGSQAIPLPDLELLANALNVQIESFFDQHGPIGAWYAQQRSIQKYVELPKEIQDFVSKPINRPYLDLAMRLSDLSADKLRSIAEGLLEITY